MTIATTKISVVIPAYNAAPWVARALRSALASAEPLGEILVVDDGSTDATAAVVQQYEPGVRLIRQANAGVSAARNRGIEEAKGEWIAFLDADDEWYAHKTGEQVAVLQRDPELRWCACNMDVVRGTRAYPGAVPAGAGEELRRGDRIHFFPALASGLVLQTSGFIIHRSLFDQVGTFDTGLKRGEDLTLWCRLACRYPLIGFTPRACFRYHAETPGSLMKNDSDRDPQVRALMDVLEWAKAASLPGAPAYLPFARKKVRDYLLRAAGNQIALSPETARKARAALSPALHERLVLRALPWLPVPIARRILNRYTL